MPTQTKTRRTSRAKQFAQIEKISIAGFTERMGPHGLHMYAEAYLSAALELPKANVPFEPVRPYLVCHAIELALKAFLSCRGTTMIDLAGSPYAHSLDSLLNTAVEAGLAEFTELTDQQSGAILSANTYYSGKVFEYPAVGEAMCTYPHMPPIDVLIEAASALVRSLRPPCRDTK
jgi:hypothetical protein